MDAALKFRNSLILAAALVGVAACGGEKTARRISTLLDADACL